MDNNWPELFFRKRGPGAAVFRVDSTPRSGQVDLIQIAAVNLKSGKINPSGGHDLTEQDRSTISAWAKDQALRDSAPKTPATKAIDAMNLAAHWVQSKASDTELDTATTDLLLAIHDLRSVLVRKSAERLIRDSD